MIFMSVVEYLFMCFLATCIEPSVNIEYGCAILRDLLNDFGDEKCAVAAYNAGPGNVYAWLADPAISPDGKTLIVENIPFEETRSYVERVESTKELMLLNRGVGEDS